MNIIQKLIHLDRSISNHYTEKHDNSWHMFFSMISHSGSLAVIGTLIVCAMLLLYEYVVWPMMLIFFAELLGLLIIILLRHATKRNRPRKLRPRWIDAWNKYSFPSHHACRAFIIASIMTLFYPTFMPLYYFWAMMIGYSRIYLLKHYFSDVVCGSLLGISVGQGVCFYFLLNYSI
ncbi:MAG: phosphatase PAP2 family protein [Candidatus Magnetomorum sp.]|nr:phosphatase PAP2 family protein [Candidatus Magnetomorum sp.]